MECFFGMFFVVSVCLFHLSEPSRFGHSLRPERSSYLFCLSFPHICYLSLKNLGSIATVDILVHSEIEWLWQGLSMILSIFCNRGGRMNAITISIIEQSQVYCLLIVLSI